MIETVSAAPVPPRGLVGRLAGALLSPQSTYAQLAERPTWAGLMAIVIVMVSAPMAVLMSTSVGQRALLDTQMQAFETFGRTVNAAQYQALQRFAAIAPYTAVANGVVGVPLGVLVVSALVLAIFTGLLGGRATFRQVFAVTTGSWVVLALRVVFSAPLDYVRQTLTSPTNLAAVLPFFEDDTFPARLLGSLDLFLIWWILNLSIGIAVLYKKRTAPVATTLLGVYVVIGLAIAIVRSLLSGA